MKARNIFIWGLIVLIGSFLLPANIFAAFTALRPIGAATVFICPLLGLVGLVFAIRERSILYSILNVLLIFSFPITMFVGYNIL